MMNNLTQPPDWFHTNLSLTRKRRAQLELLWAGLEGTLVDEQFNQLLDRAARRMRCQHTVADVRTALAPFHGREINADLRYEVTWRLATGWEQLMNRYKLSNQFEARLDPYWTALTIEDLRLTTPSLAGNNQFAITFRLHDGEFAGLSFTDKISAKWAHYKLAREIGFARFKPLNDMELVQCCLIGSLDLTDPLRPHLDDFAVTSGVLTHNRKMRKLRFTDCPMGHQWACHNCPIGHTTAQPGQLTCYRATHRATFVERPCLHCKLIQEHNPLSSDPRCIDCQARAYQYKSLVTQ